VTLEGEVVNSSGAVTGGATKNQGFGMVQRKAELAELEQDAADLRKQQDKHQKVLAGFDSERDRLLALIEAAQNVVKDRGQDHEDARVWMMNLLHEKQSTEKSLSRLENEKSGLLAGAAEGSGKAQVDLAALQEERDGLMQALAARQADSQQALQRRQELDLRLSSAQRTVREREKRLRNLVEAEESRKRKTGSLEEDRFRLEAVLADASKARVVCEKAVVDRRQELELAIGARRNLVAHLSDVAGAIKKCGEASTAFSSVLHQVELHRAKAEGKKATASERLVEEYGILAEEAEAIAGSVEIPPDAAALVSRLRRELKGLGDVNLGAIEAYDRLNERHEELVFQVEDIDKGRLEIERGIRELDRLTRDRFLSTFARLKEEFSSMFQRIFNGGEGCLDLTEGENVLDSGVEISVTIPGKKRQRLELLSGGERALSALAFLFALLKVKPSPLVVLDEVDAPLDGRNVERFIAMMRELSSTTQFILITHNPVTIESADVWFGVTMQEPGVSTVVPFKVPQGQPAVSLKG
jgi:chromosome segregation protein